MATLLTVAKATNNCPAGYGVLGVMTHLLSFKNAHIEGQYGGKPAAHQARAGLIAID